MLIKLHSQATTIPKIRMAKQVSMEWLWIIAERRRTSGHLLEDKSAA